MLHPMAKRFVEAGHEVTVFLAQPSCNDSIGEKLPGKQTVDGVTIYRTPLLKEQNTKLLARAINVVLFVGSLAAHWLLRWSKYDLMTVASFPPTVMGELAGAAGKLNGRVARNAGTQSHVRFSDVDDLLVGRDDGSRVNRFDAGQIQRFVAFIERIDVHQIQRIRLDLRSDLCNGCQAAVAGRGG